MLPQRCPDIRPGDTAGCRTEELKPISTSFKPYDTQVLPQRGATNGVGVQGKRKRGPAVLFSPAPALAGRAWGPGERTGCQAVGTKTKQPTFEKNLSGDQRSHPREGLAFWRKDKERNGEFPHPADLTSRWSAAVTG